MMAQRYDTTRYYRIDIPYGPDSVPPDPKAVQKVLDGLTDAVYPPDTGVHEVHCFVARERATEAVNLLREAGYEVD